MKKCFSLFFAFILSLGCSSLKADEGMWILSFLKKQRIQEMKKLGFKLNAEDIYDINQACLKDGIVTFSRDRSMFDNFCTGSIISKKGLVLTSYEPGYLTALSDVDSTHNYIKNGFWAKNMYNEIRDSRLYASVLISVEDVTSKIKSSVHYISEKHRDADIRKRIRKVSEAAAMSSFNAATVVPIFNSSQYLLVVYKIYRDVRLVGLPPEEMANYGLNNCNDESLNYGADFSLFRIYTDRKGRGVSYTRNNIPLKSKYSIPISTKGVKTGDFSMTIGFPSETQRYLTSYGVNFLNKTTYDTNYSLSSKKFSILEKYINESKKVHEKYIDRYKSYEYLIKYGFPNLKELDIIKKKKAQEKEYTKWANANVFIKSRYGYVLKVIDNYYKKKIDISTAFTYNYLLLGAIEPLSMASRFIGAVDCLEGGKHETSSDIIKTMMQGYGKEYYNHFDLKVEKKILAALLEEYDKKVDDKYKSKLFIKLLKKYNRNYKKFARKAARKSIFMDENKFNKFLDNPCSKKEFEKDLIFQLAKYIYFSTLALNQTDEKAENRLAEAKRLYSEGLLKMYGRDALYPDGTSSFCLSYGTVGGYSPKKGVHYKYYSTLEDMMNVSKLKFVDSNSYVKKMFDVYNKNKAGRYGENGELHTYFLTNTDIAGGNLGASVLNANGKLVGISASLNRQGSQRGLMFDINKQRSVSIDIRYILWLIDVYFGADNLVEEMEVL